MLMSSTIASDRVLVGAAQRLGAVDRGGHLENREAQAAFQRGASTSGSSSTTSTRGRPGRNPCTINYPDPRVYGVGGVAAPDTAEVLRWPWDGERVFVWWTFAHAVHRRPARPHAISDLRLLPI